MHASCVAAWTGQGWRAVLIRGASGAGKSDLALRLAERPGWRLVGDDYCHVWACDGALWARAADRLAGLIEVRGLGVVGLPARTQSRVSLMIDCTAGPVERHPQPQAETLHGVRLSRLDVDPRPASAPALIAAALRRASDGL